MQTFDLIVIGASQGGQALALYAADLGQRVVLFEKDAHRLQSPSCGPLEHLLNLTATLRKAGQLPVAGVTGQWQADFPKLLAYVKQAAEASRPPAVQHANLTTVLKQASFCGQGMVSDGKSQYRAPRIVVATGSLPLLPQQPALVQGLSETPYLTLDTLLELKELPARIAILGAGITGVQLAQALAILGTQVHLIDREDRLLPRMPAEVSAAIQNTLASDGVTFHLGSSVTAVSHRDDRITLRCADENEIITDALLLAPGRRPATASLDAAQGKLPLDEQGYIQVDAQLQTSVPGVYAIGSCVDQPAASHGASWNDHWRLIENWQSEAEKKKPLRRRNDRPRMYGVHTHPQVACAGMWRDEAELAGYRIKEATLEVAGSVNLQEKGFATAIIDEPTGMLLGVTLMGEEALHAGTLLWPLIAKGMTIDTLAHLPALPGSWADHLRKLASRLMAD